MKCKCGSERIHRWIDMWCLKDREREWQRESERGGGETWMKGEKERMQNVRVIMYAFNVYAWKNNGEILLIFTHFLMS